MTTSTGSLIQIETRPAASRAIPPLTVVCASASVSDVYPTAAVVVPGEYRNTRPEAFAVPSALREPETASSRISAAINSSRMGLGGAKDKDHHSGFPDPAQMPPAARPRASVLVASAD